MSLLLYNLLIHGVVPPVLATYYLPKILMGSKYRRSIWGRLGRLPADFVPERLGRPRLWFHAVSVGEAVALNPLVRSFKERSGDCSIAVSTGTETGQDKARGLIKEADGFLYLPLDIPALVNPVIRRIKPDVFTLMETELWPNLIYCLKRQGAAVALANGRISDRSFPRYRMLKRFFQPVLRQMDMFLMSSEVDAQRILEMGASPDKIFVTGNTKFDALPDTTDHGAENRFRRLLDLQDERRIWVAGSTHPGEHETVLDAYKELSEKYPDLILILVPRHVERAPSIIAAMTARNLPSPFLRSHADQGEKRDGRKVIIVDRTGELLQIYSMASVVFVGGSLVPRGGQNILEPAAWGRMTLFGPSMEDFRDARDILIRSGGGKEVRTLEDLTASVDRALSDPAAASGLGARAREEILKHSGSAGRNAEMLLELLRQRQG